ncbi:hypothetical protein [uncultured Cohaesibacter sp.]|uniref:hypothetical protein n=1 Tax=uncultured Cohaesibacter sp. TaxID=1002546 RepID=UPI0029C827F5|nr:hypothetical protein [uncultured Cohaesibacter sp.]
MSRANVLAFLKDESATATIEYLILTGILGIGWAAAGTEYTNQLVHLYERISTSLQRLKI